MNWREMTRQQQVTLYVVGMLDAMCAAGILAGGKYRLASDGKQNFAEMEAEGFTVTKDELHDVMNVLDGE